MPPVKGRILCVEPVSDICAIIQSMLRARGYETDSADTIAEAMEKARSGDYCLYIVDDGYQDGSSSELIERLREVAPLAPIIAFSAHAYESDRQQAMEAGASVFLVKPTDIIELTQTVSSLLRPASA